ncbi:perilipin-3-like [Alligator mississippiensis]|uniref:Perilipin-3-like n=1 Tax=Alligator mississippiensis TaxID=8496 RepID=A0A151N3L5_ALLMI|nr:perilipin-3-like [Alligator mississippiensis]
MLSTKQKQKEVMKRRHHHRYIRSQLGLVLVLLCGEQVSNYSPAMASKESDPQAAIPEPQVQEQQVPAETKDLVATAVEGTKDAVCGTVTGAKAAASSMVDVAKGAVQEGVEMTRSAVSSSMDAIIGSSLGQKVASGLDVVLGKSEQWVDHYLPMTDEELAALATSVEGAEVAQLKQQQSYYVRLGSLSTSLQQRAYQHSLGKMRLARQSALEALAQLQQAVDLSSKECTSTVVTTADQSSPIKLGKELPLAHKLRN